jgi:hypothetical protein
MAMFQWAKLSGRAYDRLGPILSNGKAKLLFRTGGLNYRLPIFSRFLCFFLRE